MSEPRSTETVTDVRLRRAPKLPIFLIIGAVLGAVVTLVVTASQPADPKVGFAATFGYFCVFGVPAGIVVGALVALILDRRSQRLSRVVSAEHEQVEAPEEAETSEAPEAAEAADISEAPETPAEGNVAPE